jgi:hypothetical protein
MGNPNTPEGKAQLERQSPISSAAKIKTPLLVAQGANDPRVKKAESERIVIALRDRGFPVEYILAPDEGHGFARPVNSMALWAASEAFFAKHLGGRFQESMTPEVAQRLKEITVDPKTVETPKAVSPMSVGVPNVVAPLTEGSSSYKIKVDMAGQSMEMASNSEIKADGDTWLVTESVKTPMGEAFDRTVLDKSTMVLKKRSITQGPVAIEFDVANDKASGQMKMGEQARPIAVDLGGALFADGAGAFAVIGALPLADGYTTSYRNLDVQTQKVKVQQMKVAGSEQVTVPAGTFDAFKTEISSEDGSKITVWISKADRKVVKIVASLPRLNGGTMTSELQ